MADDIPQWKKDLIARLRNQNKLWSKNFISPHQVITTTSAPNHRVQQPNNNNMTNGTTNNSVLVVAAVGSSVALPSSSSSSLSSKNQHQTAGGGSSSYVSKMVQERVRLENMVNFNGRTDTNSDDSDEDLRYGPGIVSKLKNKYLSLALRENNARQRPSILPMRKAASLENLLDEPSSEQQPPQQPPIYKKYEKTQNQQQQQQRYPRTTNRTTPEMKRARSVETISRNHHRDDDDDDNEEVVIKPDVEENPKQFQKQTSLPIDVTNLKYKRINRPKRIMPIMNEKEKPPTDVVKQTKLLFERRPEQRTRAPPQTGDVAAKIDTYNSIIVKSKTKTNKPPIVKTKPKSLDLVVNNKKNKLPSSSPSPLSSPIPDVSRIGKDPGVDANKGSSLCETPDLILTSSPINNNGGLMMLLSPTFRKTTTETFLNQERCYNKPPSPVSPINPIISQQSVDDETDKQIQTIVNKNISNVKTPTTQLLKIETNNVVVFDKQLKTSPIIEAKILTITEIEKNHINNVKSQQQQQNGGGGGGGGESEVKKFLVPKKQKTTTIEPTTAVFNFTNRKDVPDYIANDKSRTTTRPTLPKPGEGGVILISGASVTESFTDEDEEIMRSLECPPSPCDVTFVNDNILIDGKSSLSQKTKRAKMRISFVDAGPEVFEYPSETSLLLDETTTISQQSGNSSQVGHSVPNLSGSTLANYTPKSTEDFQPGITQRTTPTTTTTPSSQEVQDVVLEEIEEPILFSAGTNSDILF